MPIFGLEQKPPGLRYSFRLLEGSHPCQLFVVRYYTIPVCIGGFRSTASSSALLVAWLGYYPRRGDRRLRFRRPRKRLDLVRFLVGDLFGNRWRRWFILSFGAGIRAHRGTGRRGIRTGINFDFGLTCRFLSSFHYSFIGYNRLADASHNRSPFNNRMGHQRVRLLRWECCNIDGANNNSCGSKNNTRCEGANIRYP